MTHIYYLPDERLVEVTDTETILEAALCAGIPHTHVCGGSARCSTCRVWVMEGLEHCIPANDAEQALAKRLQLDPRVRLACQTAVMGEGKITLRRVAIDTEEVELLDARMIGKVMPTAIGQEKYLAILFADLRGFTTFSEALPPYDVIYVLNRYFRLMGRAIATQGGIINNYMGDGLMALFGWDDRRRAAERAVRASLDMLEEMEQLNIYLNSLYNRTLQIGIGIHCGQVVIGSVGASPESHHMTAIGDAVNLASRIESANKKTGTRLLISAETYAEVQDKVTVRQTYSVEIPGKSGQYLLYEVIAIAPSSAQDSQIISRDAIAPSKSFRLSTLLARIRQFFRWLVKE
jgi:adenylate cyclase